MTDILCVGQEICIFLLLWCSSVFNSQWCPSWVHDTSENDWNIDTTDNDDEKDSIEVGANPDLSVIVKCVNMF